MKTKRIPINFVSDCGCNHLIQIATKGPQRLRINCKKCKSYCQDYYLIDTKFVYVEEFNDYLSRRSK